MSSLDMGVLSTAVLTQNWKWCSWCREVRHSIGHVQKDTSSIDFIWSLSWRRLKGNYLNTPSSLLNYIQKWLSCIVLVLSQDPERTGCVKSINLHTHSWVNKVTREIRWINRKLSSFKKKKDTQRHHFSFDQRLSPWLSNRHTWSVFFNLIQTWEIMWKRVHG